MRRVLLSLTPFGLALVLALGSVGFAKSRHAGQGVDSFVICTGYGLVTITVDETGKRVAEGVPCPDSMVLAAALPVHAPAVSFARMVVDRVVLGADDQFGAGQGQGAWQDPRAPPILVLRMI
jgi:hypothetical protein